MRSIPAYGYYYLPVPGPGGLREALASESLSGERGTQAALLRNLLLYGKLPGRQKQVMYGGVQD